MKLKAPPFAKKLVQKSTDEGARLWLDAATKLHMTPAAKASYRGMIADGCRVGYPQECEKAKEVGEEIPTKQQTAQDMLNDKRWKKILKRLDITEADLIGWM